MPKLSSLVILIYLLIPPPGWCERYRFRHFGAEEGLSTSVSSILQDRAGFLWIATANGLFRYDGTVFQPYGIEEGLPSGSIRAMAESPDGVLWVLTAGGLAQLRGSAFESVDTGAPAASLSSLGISPQGKVYAGSDRGMFVASASGVTHPEFLPVSAAPRQPITSILAERDGQVWFGCGTNLCLLEKSGVKVLGDAAGLPDDRWIAILRDREGTLWLRSGQHLYILAPGATRFVARDRELPASTGPAVGLVQDAEGRVWTSTDEGIAYWTATGWRAIGGVQGLPAVAATALWPDHEGSLWIGLWGSGVARWSRPFQWTNWTTADGLPDSNVTAVVRENSGNLWVGTAHGLIRFGPGKAIRIWDRRSGLPGDRVTALVSAPDGAVWVACDPGGLSRIAPDGRAIHTYNKASGLDDKRIHALLFDRNQRLWIAEEQGIFRSREAGSPDHFERIETPGPAGSGDFTALASDRAGNVWVATSRGLLRRDESSWTRVDTDDGLRSSPLHSLVSTPDGAIWFGYRDPLGIARLTSSAASWRVQPVTRSGGLPSEDVRFLGRDARGQIWAGTDRGVASGVPGNWRIWSAEDGLLSPETSGNSFFSGTDGTVWFGTTAGLARFTPAPGGQEAVPPLAAITAIRFGSRERTAADFAVAAPGDRDFEASIRALGLAGRRDIHLRYRLSGKEERWVETSEASVRFANLSPGSYRFEVQSRYGNGPWSTRSSAVYFRILPSWWQAWWFAAMVALAAAGLFYGALSWCVARLREEERRLAHLGRTVPCLNTAAMPVVPPVGAFRAIREDAIRLVRQVRKRLPAS